MKTSPSTPVPRRQVLAALGASAGLPLCEKLTAAADSPAVSVSDRTSSIRISRVTPHVCRDRVYVKVETNHGVTGWGEVKGVIPSVAATLIAAMFELLDGQNPTRIEYLWQSLYRAERNQRGGAFMLHAISGIDMALWDISGKLWQVPVYRLLGGPLRDFLRVYPSPNAIKIGMSPKPQSASPADVESMVAAVRAAREKVGRDGAVMFDAHSALPPATLIQFASAIEPFELLFLEEPAVPGNIDVFKRIRQQVRVPLAAGERDRTIWGILPYLTEGVLDVIQPDCGFTGGISQMKKIATLAEAWTVPLAPHCTQSYLGMTASFHVSFAIPHFLIHEAYDDELLGRIVKPHWSKSADGRVSLPEGVGLCVDIDEGALATIAADPQYKYRWRGPQHSPDGSVTDY